MSMNHDCRCGLCNRLMPPEVSPVEAAEIVAFNREYGAKMLASAILKIAPQQATEIAERWEALLDTEHSREGDVRLARLSTQR